MIKTTGDRSLAEWCANKLREKGVFCEVHDGKSEGFYITLREQDADGWAVRIDLEAAFQGEVVRLTDFPA